VLLGTVVVLAGCASTEPVEADVDDALPAQVDAATETTDGSTEPETFPRELPIEVRKSSFGVGILFETWFGQW